MQGLAKVLFSAGLLNYTCEHASILTGLAELKKKTCGRLRFCSTVECLHFVCKDSIQVEQV